MSRSRERSAAGSNLPVAFLASPQASVVTGQTLFVDGGKSLGGQAI